MANLKGKKLLILAGAMLHVKVVEAAKSLGVYTIVTDYLQDSPAKLIADEAWMFDVKDVDSIVKKCKDEKVNGVLSFCIDPCQRPYVEICDKLNLPCYCNVQQIQTMTDKNNFKNFCKQCGVDTIVSFNEDEIENGNVDFPIFIKPSDSRGSRGQTICFSKEECRKAITLAKKESINGQIVIEKYMKGYQDLTVAYTVKNDEAFLTGCGDRYLGKEEDGLNRQAIAGVSPSSYASKYMKNVDSRVKNMIKMLGIKNGPVFMQGFIDGETVRFYDPGLRYPGSDYEILLRDITGIDLMKSLIEFSLTGIYGDYGDLKDAYNLGGNISVQLMIDARAGKIGTYEGFDELIKMPYVATVSKRSKVGEVIPASGDVRQRIAEIQIITKDKEKIRDYIKSIYDSIKVLDENGKDMVVSKFNYQAENQ